MFRSKSRGSRCSDAALSTQRFVASRRISRSASNFGSGSTPSCPRRPIVPASRRRSRNTGHTPSGLAPPRNRTSDTWPSASLPAAFVLVPAAYVGSDARQTGRPSSWSDCSSDSPTQKMIVGATDTADAERFRARQSGNCAIRRLDAPESGGAGYRRDLAKGTILSGCRITAPSAK
jgi:hypothetical protein